MESSLPLLTMIMMRKKKKKKKIMMATTTTTISFVCMTITKYYSIAKAT